MSWKSTAMTAVPVALFAAWACTSEDDVRSRQWAPIDPSLEPRNTPPPSSSAETGRTAIDKAIDLQARQTVDAGRAVFRFDTFGSEAFFGGKLRLHETVAKLSPKQALGLGLKVDMNAIPPDVVDALKAGKVDLDDPENTALLLKVNAVVGVKGVFDAGGGLSSVGITCSFCHATVDNAFAPGIGNRLDAWPNRDLDVGKIVSSAPTVKPYADLLGVDEATVRKVLTAWGPGMYDAELNQDGKALRPDGKTGATVIPAAYGLSGVHLHTYTGWGSVPYWNAYVANTQMMGSGRFFDPRLADRQKFPLVAKTGFDDKRDPTDLISSKLPALHFYQLAISAPKPPAGSFDANAAKRGEVTFNGKAKCSGCHTPPTYTEPGWGMHKGAEIGIDDFQANRSPDGMYRTTPLAGLFTRLKPGLYHDGRFETLEAVLRHYESVLKIRLTDAERSDLVEFLKSI
jgi:hypothetical protein